MDKEKSLKRIHKLTRKKSPSSKKLSKRLQAHEIAIRTLKFCELGDEFDLLCVVDGQKKRLPFSTGRQLSPIAIFPFAHDAHYIELDEQENKKHTDKDVDNSRLLDREFCEHVYKIKDRINLYLQALNKPLLQGGYLAESNYMHGSGWIIGFDDNEFNTLASDYYGGNLPEKLRYSGTFIG